jgi:AcrR family transcriptional regulator
MIEAKKAFTPVMDIQAILCGKGIMDRRQKRTREAIYTAFGNLLSQKSYSAITVKEIIDLANIGRSTFYSHFETKDALLSSISDDLFDHVFILQGKGEEHEHSDSVTLQEQLAHFAYHAKNNPLYHQLLTSSSSSLFYDDLQTRLVAYFVDKLQFKNTQVPRRFLVQSVVSGFLNILEYWLQDGMKETPEELEAYFEATLGPILA